MLKSIHECEEILKSETSSINDKYDAVYNLWSWNTEEALEALKWIYPYLNGSELLQHEVMYIFG